MLLFILFLSVIAYLIKFCYLILDLFSTFIAKSFLLDIYSTRYTSPKEPVPKSWCAINDSGPIFIFGYFFSSGSLSLSLTDPFDEGTRPCYWSLAKGALIVRWLEAGLFSFDVVDMLGNKVMTQNLGVVNGLYRQSIDASSWNAGIYFININSSEGGSITKKINVIK